MDWEAWARRLEEAHDPDVLAAMFAPGGTFCDPVTPVTTDIRSMAEHTSRIFPDWRQQVQSIRGGDDWAFFEWTGAGTYRGPGAEDGPGFPVAVEGATVVEVDGAGLVTRWRDYLDTHAAIQQVTAGLEASGAGSEDPNELVSDWEAHFADDSQL